MKETTKTNDSLTEEKKTASIEESKPKKDITKKPKPEVLPENEQVAYRHAARQGMVSLLLGTEPLTNKPIERIIQFRDHLYSTKDPVEIEKLDAWCEKAPESVKRFDYYKLLEAAQPQYVTMEVDGKKVRVPMELLKEAYIKNTEQENS